jgi:WD repeat-containing protein 23
MENGTCSIHSWNDGAEEDEAEPKMGLRVNPKLEVDPEFYAEVPPTRSSRRIRGARRGVRIFQDDV